MVFDRIAWSKTDSLVGTHNVTLYVVAVPNRSFEVPREVVGYSFWSTDFLLFGETRIKTDSVSLAKIRIGKLIEAGLAINWEAFRIVEVTYEHESFEVATCRCFQLNVLILLASVVKTSDS